MREQGYLFAFARHFRYRQGRLHGPQLQPRSRRAGNALIKAKKCISSWRRNQLYQASRVMNPRHHGLPSWSAGPSVLLQGPERTLACHIVICGDHAIVILIKSKYNLQKMPVPDGNAGRRPLLLAQRSGSVPLKKMAMLQGLVRQHIAYRNGPRGVAPMCDLAKTLPSSRAQFRDIRGQFIMLFHLRRTLEKINDPMAVEIGGINCISRKDG